jgi:hypothetical protein
MVDTVLTGEPYSKERQLEHRDAEKITERTMLNLLRARYSAASGNGPRWAFFTHVRDRAGFDATRTLDAVAMDTWPSSGCALHGIEVKVSRADWLRELGQPNKAAAFVRFMDYFWIAAPFGVVRGDELPTGWGLLETRAPGGLRLSVKASRLLPEPVDRSFMACLMRAACRGGR